MRKVSEGFVCIPLYSLRNHSIGSMKINTVSKKPICENANKNNETDQIHRINDDIKELLK
jgi:hypothetical protein